MTLEAALKDNADAIKAQTIAINHLVVALGKHLNTTAPAEDKPKAQAKPKAAPEPEVIDDLDDFEDITDEVTEYPALPAGERNEAYFAKHVRPVLKALADKNRDALITLLGNLGAVKATDIAPADWDKAVYLAKQG